MAYRVEVTARAEKDANGILEWLLSEGAGERGTRWFQSLADAIDSLSEFPLRCPLAPENGNFRFEVRNLFYGESPNVYRILFTVVNETVFVLSIRHGRRRPLKP